VVLGINSEPPETARRYLEAHAVSFPTVTDRDGELARRDAVRAMPVGVVIDRSGRVSAHFTGLRDESAWPDALRKAGLGAGRADHTGKGGRR
jgi:peroxiredoxin